MHINPRRIHNTKDEYRTEGLCARVCSHTLPCNGLRQQSQSNWLGYHRTGAMNNFPQIAFVVSKFLQLMLACDFALEEFSKHFGSALFVNDVQSVCEQCQCVCESM